ncbi:MAG TPA: trypsin-like serine protease [Terriglobales bacterium]|nr:trypsin-like serine protease [Terriglobales bacterium]
MTFENKIKLHSCRRRFGWWLLVAVGALTTVYGIAQESEKNPGVTTSLRRESVKAQADRDANKFKTREGRLQAKPLDWNATIGKPTPRAKVSEAEEEMAKKREPSSAKGGSRNPNAKREAQRLHPEDWKRISEPATGHTMGMLREDLNGKLVLTAGSPDVFTQYCESCPSVNPDAPSAAIGKLFTNEGTCSASVISGNNVIVTAGHCCYDRTSNNWIGGWSFVPAYDNGNAPFGTFDWSAATTLTSWVNNGDIPSDVCLINLQNDSAGHGVAYYTGWLGRAWDWGSDQELHALGYPENLGNTQTLELCTAESFSPDGSCGGDGVLNMGCSMTFGSSGGPWVMQYRGNDLVNATVHGYTSQSCTGTFGETFNGPRFTSGNIATLCSAAGC